jgi:hypothetical protein
MKSIKRTTNTPPLGSKISKEFLKNRKIQDLEIFWKVLSKQLPPGRGLSIE